MASEFEFSGRGGVRVDLLKVRVDLLKVRVDILVETASELIKISKISRYQRYSGRGGVRVDQDIKDISRYQRTGFIMGFLTHMQLLEGQGANWTSINSISLSLSLVCTIL